VPTDFDLALSPSDGVRLSFVVLRMNWSARFEEAVGFCNVLRETPRAFLKLTS
jgi:hypothetical protein